MPYVTAGDVLTSSSFTTLITKINQARTRFGLANTTTISTDSIITSTKISE